MNRPRVLIADDSPSMRQLLAFELGRAGYDALLAEDGRDALDQLEAGHAIELALVDLHMPRLDGVALIEALRRREQTRFVPIVVLSTEARREPREQARRLGATGWMVKPFEVTALIAVVQQLVPTRGG